MSPESQEIAVIVDQLSERLRADMLKSVKKLAEIYNVCWPALPAFPRAPLPKNVIDIQQRRRQTGSGD